jgi:dienelactone hydrolase
LDTQFGPKALLARETHAAVEAIAVGEGADKVYIFLPEQPALNGPAPIVFLHHGWGGMDPLNFGALIDHLTREGQIVVYPVYQTSTQDAPQNIVEHAVQSDLYALSAIHHAHLSIDPRRVLYVGYSMGAAISLDIAIEHHHFGLPAPKAMVLMAPGDSPAVATGAEARSIIGPLAQISPDLPIAILTGAEDTSIGLPTARRIFAQICQVRPDRRILMVLPGDTHDGVTVHARHGSPGAPDPRYDFPLSSDDFNKVIPGQNSFFTSVSLNQLDFYGYWKVIDAMVMSLQAGSLPSVVFGHGNPGQLYLGDWPDGSLYPPIDIEDPCQTPASGQ